MNIRTDLQEIVNRHDLLRHPFYKSWSAGTLPLKALTEYAQEYGAFIESLPQGWTKLGDAETAAEEREHAEMWSSFTAELGGVQADPQISQTVALAATARKLFANRAAALGALYAFEVQQPATASSKLDGLRKFYRISAAAEDYFKAHSANWHESEKLLAQIEALPVEDQARALSACAEMAEALWDGLTGIREHACVN